jgi:hypothetical protein
LDRRAPRVRKHCGKKFFMLMQIILIWKLVVTLCPK